MPEVQTTPMTGETLEAFKDQVREVQKFITNKFDMNQQQRASLLMNILTIECIDLFEHSKVGARDYVQQRIENFATCLTRNFNPYIGTKLRVGIIVTNEGE